jgi:S-adenosylmethionine synthetase
MTIRNSTKDFIFTSESVSEGHPDKICDQISDALVDLYLSKDPYARTAIETVATTDYVGVMGEVRCAQPVTADEIESVIRQKVADTGYEQDGFNHKTLEINNRIHSQSADIAMGVDEGTGTDNDEGAGDQGIMFGYACRERNDRYMPDPIYYSHKILRNLSRARHKGELPMLGPDAKSQVSLRYQDGKTTAIESIVLSTQHIEGYSPKDIEAIVLPYIQSAFPEDLPFCKPENLFVNPTGRFVIGGPVGDSGLTGRKIIVDSYGGSAPHGGGAFSGKDPTKVDRSAAYAARYVAKNIVAAGYAEKCTIQLSYAIGVSRPISVYFNMHDTGNVSEEALYKAIKQLVDLSPKGIREHLQLNRPIYGITSAYGHFGRKPRENGAFSWEKLDLVDPLRNILG